MERYNLSMYLSWNEKKISDFSDEYIESAYNDGYVFTRVGKGVMKQTRSLRIDLSKFELSSENKRILKKTEELNLNISPIPYATYTWEIHKLGKDFYEQKFGKGTFSAQKIKELITDQEKSNFNQLFVYTLPTVILNTVKNPLNQNERDPSVAKLPQDDSRFPVGYCIALETKNIIHYCYPFYNLGLNYPNLGMGMMLKAIVWAKENNKQHIYLGSFSRPADTYKLQFSGLEWFDGKSWQINTEPLKIIFSD
jgi:arginyl-tRNA--protein-N-Asp/Glu arginylyltransferase